MNIPYVHLYEKQRQCSSAICFDFKHEKLPLTSSQACSKKNALMKFFSSLNFCFTKFIYNLGTSKFTLKLIILRMHNSNIKIL